MVKRSDLLEKSKPYDGVKDFKVRLDQLKKELNREVRILRRQQRLLDNELDSLDAQVSKLSLLEMAFDLLDESQSIVSIADDIQELCVNLTQQLALVSQWQEKLKTMYQSTEKRIVQFDKLCALYPMLLQNSTCL
jgi:hypothetical protein